MFGRVELLQNQTNEVITLPQTAIAYNPYGDTVFKVVEQTPEGGGEPEKRSKRVNVRTGETRGDQVQIVSGVDAGDEVVVAGQIKLRGGDRLIIDNEVLPENKAEVGQARNY
jgi:membrane fusion protein (multidrug efflux system)